MGMKETRTDRYRDSMLYMGITTALNLNTAKVNIKVVLNTFEQKPVLLPVFPWAYKAVDSCFKTVLSTFHLYAMHTLGTGWKFSPCYYFSII